MSGTPLLAMRWAEPVPARRARRHLDRDKRYEPGELAMTESTMFVEETQRQIEALGASDARITLMSVSAPLMSPNLLESAVRTAATALDVVGPAGDGSVGLLSLWSVGPDGGAGVEHRFLPRMQAILAPMARHRDIGTVRFRAVHRWACEMTDAADLFDSLFDAPSVVLTVSAFHSSSHFQLPRLAPFVASLLFPWRSSPVGARGRSSRQGDE
jgi:hypothetical protein